MLHTLEQYGSIVPEETIKQDEVEELKNTFPILNSENMEKKFSGTFEALNEIKKKNELFKHLEEMQTEKEQSHFNDAIEMSEVIEGLWDEKIEDIVMASIDDIDVDKLKIISNNLNISEEIDETKSDIKGELKRGIADKLKENMLYATLVHDIGKNGPAFKENDDLDQARHLTRIIFRPSSDKSGVESKVRDIKIHDFLEQRKDLIKEELGIDLEEAEEILKKDLNETDETLVNKSMINFWRDHVDWGNQILEKANVNKYVQVIASSHHAYNTDKNPAGLYKPVEEYKEYNETYKVNQKYEELMKTPEERELMLDCSSILTIVDVYQALTAERSGNDHQQAMNIMKKYIIVPTKQVSAEETLRLQKLIDIFNKKEGDDSVPNEILVDIRENTKKLKKNKED